MLTAILILVSISTAALLFLFPLILTLVVSIETIKKNGLTAGITTGYLATKIFQIEREVVEISTTIKVLSEFPMPDLPPGSAPQVHRGPAGGVEYRTFDGKHAAAELGELFKKMLGDPSYFSTDEETDKLKDAFGFQSPPLFGHNSADPDNDDDEDEDAR